MQSNAIVRYKTAARLLLLFLIGLLILLVVPTKLFTTQTIPDKEIHAVIFTALSFVVWFSLHLRLIWQWLLLIALAVLTEWLQNFIPYRDASLSDLLANFVGIAIGYALILSGVGLIKWRRYLHTRAINKRSRQ